MSLFGSDLVGHALILRSTDDPPGGWAFELDGEAVAELAWSRDDRAVRMETDEGVCLVRFGGIFSLRGVVVVGEDEVVPARYRGGLSRGRAMVEPGRVFDFFSQVDPGVGPWRGVDDAEGEAVLRLQGRWDLGINHYEVLVTSNALYAPFLGPLLALLGGLHVQQRRRPWLGFSATLARGR